MDKELIDHIANQLKNHEEVYLDGAWERFEQKTQKKRMILWPYWAAASALLVLGYWYMGKQNHTAQTIVDKTSVAVNHSKIKKSIEQPLEKTPNSTKSTDVETAEQIYTTPPKLGAATQKSSNTSKTDFATIVPDLIKTENTTAPVVDETSDKQSELTLPITTQTHTQPELNNQTKPLWTNTKSEDKKLANSKKWEPDVFIAPAMGNDNKVNLNYGLSLAYHIGEKLALSSGISYGVLSDQSNLNVDGVQNLSAKNLESVNTKISGISVPLEIRYKVSDNLYASVGVSATAVLNTAQQNTYVSNEVQNTSVINAFGIAENRAVIVKEREREDQPENNINVNDYLGFYNFSFGYKQKVTSKNHVILEPFVRLPMHTASNNLNLTNGGLRVKFNF